MLRHRQVAASPRRSSSETWTAIASMIVDTLDRSPSIDDVDIENTLTVAAPIGRMLVAGGHLEKHPIVVVADPLHISITTISGGGALDLDEKLDPVPGGAAATEWMIYLPTPDPHGDAVRAVVKDSPHLSADDPPSTASPSAAKSTEAGLLDMDALDRMMQERR
jgi:hypothetical protein